MTVTFDKSDGTRIQMFAAYYNYDTDPKTSAPCLNISALLGYESAYSSEESYNKLIREKKFCLLEFNSKNEVSIIFLPKDIATNTVETNITCHALLPVSDREKREVKYSPDINIGILSDEDIVNYSEKLRNSFVQLANDKTPFPLTGRGTVAPTTPKSKGGSWSRLFNKNS
jgi:hypothetical protein